MPEYLLALAVVGEDAVEEECCPVEPALLIAPRFFKLREIILGIFDDDIAEIPGVIRLGFDAAQEVLLEAQHNILLSAANDYFFAIFEAECNRPIPCHDP